MAFWTEYLACAVCAISGALAAEGKRIDLFGAIVLAVVTAVGGGTVRDLCLGSEPVFWIKDPHYLTTALGAAVGTFILVRFVHMPQRALAVADAFGLALFGIIGTEKALAFGTTGTVAIMLGIVTAVAGGIMRDVLRGEIPLTMKIDVNLYATAVFVGALVFVLLKHYWPSLEASRYIGMSVILLLRLTAMRWQIKLPVYRTR